ncbi:neuromedin-B receptor-like [Menidia menidia]
METRRRLAKIVLVFVGLFAVCWLPNHLLYLYRSFRDQQPDLSLTHLLLTLTARPLSFCSSCLNPLALCLLSHSFRQHFSRRLRCVRGPRPERQASYLHSTSHIRLTSVRKGPAAITAPATIMAAAPVANGNADEQEVVL